MKQIKNFEENCSVCEYAQEIFGGEYCICKKKGIVPPHGICRKFCFDPLRVKVSVRKAPEFRPILNFSDENTTGSSQN